jgi:hypothetical protein
MLALIRRRPAEAKQPLEWACRTNPRDTGAIFLRAYIAWKASDDAAAAAGTPPSNRQSAPSVARAHNVEFVDIDSDGWLDQTRSHSTAAADDGLMHAGGKHSRRRYPAANWSD